MRTSNLLCAMLVSTAATVARATESPEEFATLTGPCVNAKIVKPNVQGLSSIPVVEVSPAGIPFVCLDKQQGQSCKTEELTPLHVTRKLGGYLDDTEGTEIGPSAVLQYSQEGSPEGFTSLNVTSTLGKPEVMYLHYINLLGVPTSEEVDKFKQRSWVYKTALENGATKLLFRLVRPSEIYFELQKQAITYSLVLDESNKPTNTYLVEIKDYESDSKQTHNATVGPELKAFLDKNWNLLKDMGSVVKSHCPECSADPDWFWIFGTAPMDMSRLSLEFPYNLVASPEYFVKIKKGDTISVSPQGTFTLLGKYDVDVSVAMEVKEGIKACQRFPKQRELFGALMQYYLLLLQQDPLL